MPDKQPEPITGKDLQRWRNFYIDKFRPPARLVAEVTRLQKLCDHQSFLLGHTSSESEQQAVSGLRTRIAELEVEASGSTLVRCHNKHESPRALWVCPACHSIVEHVVIELRQGLAYLGQAIEHGNCDAIRERWGGNTPEDWCGEVDALDVLLRKADKLRERVDKQGTELEEWPALVQDATGLGQNPGEDCLDAVRRLRKRVESQKEDRAHHLRMLDESCSAVDRFGFRSDEHGGPNLPECIIKLGQDREGLRTRLEEAELEAVRIADAVEVAKKYAQHAKDCLLGVSEGEHFKHACTCGLTKSLLQIGAQK